jgi:hypothetical protein
VRVFLPCLSVKFWTLFLMKLGITTMILRLFITSYVLIHQQHKYQRRVKYSSENISSPSMWFRIVGSVRICRISSLGWNLTHSADLF